MLFLLCSWGSSRGQVYRDSSFVPPVNETAPFYAQNALYKSRLDSIPATVSLTYNDYVQKYIDVYAARKGQIARVLGLSLYYFPIFEQALKEFGLPEELKYVAIVESELDPHAVSRSGATGPWQFMFSTAKGYHLSMDKHIDERKDPVAASRAAAAYFRDAFADLGDWLLAIAAYNCGKGAVTRAIQRAGGKADFWEIRRFLPEQTRNYVPAFIATTYIMKYHRKHDILPAAAGLPVETETIEVSSDFTLEEAATATRTDLDLILVLNPAFKKRRIHATPANPRHLVIPAVRDNTTYAALYTMLNRDPGTASEKSAFTATAGKAAAAETVAYKVRSGDTLSGIAEKFRQTIASIKSKNGLKSNRLQPGMVLRLKG